MIKTDSKAMVVLRTLGYTHGKEPTTWLSEQQIWDILKGFGGKFPAARLYPELNALVELKYAERRGTRTDYEWAVTRAGQIVLEKDPPS